MNKVICFFVGCALCQATAVAQQVHILNLSRGNELLWTNSQAALLAQFEISTNPVTDQWRPFYYDFAGDGTFQTALPKSAADQTFYRVGIVTNIQDPDLILHLPFDNDFTKSGGVVDISGYGNHGLRYGRPCCPTNWPSTIVGPDGSQAAEFHWYSDGYGLYGKSGDYVVVPRADVFTNLPRATFCAWVHYYRGYDSNYVSDQAATILNSGHATAGIYYLGRGYSPSTSFRIYTNVTDEVRAVTFPDYSAPDGDSGGWHHYAVTFDQGTVVGYFDGRAFHTNTLPVPALTMAGSYIGIGCWTFNKTPEMNLSVDAHPNNAWINGTVDDIRIYKKVLSDSDVLNLYHSFDKAPPASPANLTWRAESSSQIELKWDSALDPFGVVGYRVYRDSNLVAETSQPFLLDGGLSPASAYSYTVTAFDLAGNVSEPSDPAVATTLSTPGQVDFIVDDDDPAPYMEKAGDWVFTTLYGGYWGVGYVHDNGTAKGAKEVVFRPDLPEAGTYQVSARWVSRSNRSTNTPVVIEAATATNTVFVNQRNNNNIWVSLGSLVFDAGTNGVVRIRNEGTTGLVVGDAVRFVK